MSSSVYTEECLLLVCLYSMLEDIGGDEFYEEEVGSLG